MKMISHKAPGKSISYGRDVFLVETKKMVIIFVLEKDIGTVITPIVDMIIVSRL